ncbi:hypothetical protein B9Z55_028077 [Caenorhabditis nigoni]|uniref:Uncharacterized protein n=2 Tax=Caenorhabditis nigoni TaxID=1611254 RepID=A0A2G5SD99_9PELO|nr:hypothetical protein B9Z55_028077 [Caenorhabditis nigoni]
MSRILSFESIPAEMFERESSDQESENFEDFVSVASFQSGSEDVYGTPPRSSTFGGFGGFIKQKPVVSMWSFDSIPGAIFRSRPVSNYDDASTYLKSTSNQESQLTLASGRTISSELIPRADTFSAFEEPSAISYKLSFGSIPKENMKPNFVSRSPLFAHNRRNRLRIQKQLSVSDDIITEEPQPESTKDESDQQPQDPGPKVPIVWSNCICCVTVEIMCRIYETCLAICNR